MSNAAMIPMLIILLLAGGIFTWGAMTDWTFSGLLPRKGAKCTPDEDSEVENATEYVYDKDKKCTVVNKCEKDWEPNTSNTACEFSSGGETCTPTGTPVPNGKYILSKTTGKCELNECENNFKLNVAGTACDTCKDSYILDDGTCRTCKATDVPVLTGMGIGQWKDLPGQTYKTENSNCIPNRMIFGGNDGSSSCYKYCAGVNGTSWNTITPPEWKGAKCVGATAGADATKFSTTVTCETTGADKIGDDKSRCVCERNDATPWVNDGWEPEGGERLFGKDNITRSWLMGYNNAGVGWGVDYIKTSDGKLPKNATECLTLAKANGYKALGMRGYDSTCWGLTQAGLTAGTGMDANSNNNHYMICVDDKTKKVWPNKCV